MTHDPEEIRIDARDAALHALGITDLATVQRVMIDPTVVTVTRYRTGADGQVLATGDGPATVTTTIGYTKHQHEQEAHQIPDADLLPETCDDCESTGYNCWLHDDCESANDD